MQIFQHPNITPKEFPTDAELFFHISSRKSFACLVDVNNQNTPLQAFEHSTVSGVLDLVQNASLGKYVDKSKCVITSKHYLIPELLDADSVHQAFLPGQSDSSHIPFQIGNGKYQVGMESLDETDRFGVVIPSPIVNFHFLEKYSINQEYKILVNLFAYGLEICILKQKTPVFSNFFDVKSKEDTLYFILNAVQQLGIFPGDTQILVTGLSNNSALYQLLERYFNTIHLMHLPFSMRSHSDLLRETQLIYATTLFLLCEL